MSACKVEFCEWRWKVSPRFQASVQTQCGSEWLNEGREVVLEKRVLSINLYSMDNHVSYCVVCKDSESYAPFNAIIESCWRIYLCKLIISITRVSIITSIVILTYFFLSTIIVYRFSFWITKAEFRKNAYLRLFEALWSQHLVIIFPF